MTIAWQMLQLYNGITIHCTQVYTFACLCCSKIKVIIHSIMMGKLNEMTIIIIIKDFYSLTHSLTGYNLRKKLLYKSFTSLLYNSEIMLSQNKMHYF